MRPEPPVCSNSLHSWRRSSLSEQIEYAPVTLALSGSERTLFKHESLESKQCLSQNPPQLQASMHTEPQQFYGEIWKHSSLQSDTWTCWREITSAHDDLTESRCLPGLSREKQNKAIPQLRCRFHNKIAWMMFVSHCHLLKATRQNAGAVFPV